MKHLTLAKEVFKPCVIGIADIILGDGAVRKLKQVALLNNTISSGIKYLSINIGDQQILDSKASLLKISIQLDESTDVSNYRSIGLETYPKLAKKALAVLLPFSTTYLCEVRFSFLVYLRNKYQN